MKRHLGVIQSSDCFAAAQRAHVLAEFPEDGIEYTPVGALWRIVVRAAPDGGRGVWPLLERSSWRCRVCDQGIFECDTWPYQVQPRHGRRTLTLTPECPAVTDGRLGAMRTRGAELLPDIRAELDRYPERLIPDYDGVIELADLDPAP